MAWDSRGYYYRSRRFLGQVRRVYLGRNPIAHMIALSDEVRRERCRGLRDLVNRERRFLQELDGSVQAVCNQAQLLGEAALLVTGHYQHHRGEWRRRRVNLPAKTDPSPLPSDSTDLAALVALARRGAHSVLPCLREFLQDPDALTRLGGNRACQIEERLLACIAREDLHLRNALELKVRLLRMELASPNLTPLETFLVARVVVSWLLLEGAKLGLQQTQITVIVVSNYGRKRLERLRRQYRRGLKILSTVRKKATPILAR